MHISRDGCSACIVRSPIIAAHACHRNNNAGGVAKTVEASWTGVDLGTRSRWQGPRRLAEAEKRQT